MSRPNRFIAHVELEGKREICHVKNTGRCKELLFPGARVILHRPGTEGRKTEYDLVSVQKGDRLVNMDSQAANKIAREWLETLGFSLIQSEKTYKNSRFDFYLEKGNKKIFAEVKGDTLEQEGLAMFPDAPTERGVKHLRELMECKREGFEVWVIFIIQMKGVHSFSPNWETHPEFAKTLFEARKKGVWITVLDCVVTEDEVVAEKSVPLVLT